MKIETKFCSKCKKVKNLDEFSKDKQRKDDLSYYCKECQRTRGKIYYLNNAEKVNNRIKEYRKNNIEKVREFSRKCTKEWQKNNTEHRKEYVKQYYKDNKGKERLRSIRFFENNPDYRKQYNKKWKENNPDYEKEWLKNKRKNYPWFRLSKNISRQIRKSLSCNKDGCHWEDLLGYTLIDLISHLEKLFKIGMSFNNYGKWHVDHIKPVSSFNFNSYDDPEFKECWALANLQPLWAEENMKKSNKILLED